MSDRDIELLTKLAINQEVIPTLDVDSYGRAQADGSLDMADWADEQEERAAGHVSRRVAAIAGMTRMVFDEVPPAEVLAWLSEHIEVPEGDDAAVRVTALGDLALHPEKHVELRARGDTGQDAQDQSDLDAFLGERYGWRDESGRRKKAKTPAPAQQAPPAPAPPPAPPQPPPTMTDNGLPRHDPEAGYTPLDQLGQRVKRGKDAPDFIPVQLPRGSVVFTPDGGSFEV